MLTPVLKAKHTRFLNAVVTHYKELKKDIPDLQLRAITHNAHWSTAHMVIGNGKAAQDHVEKVFGKPRIKDESASVHKPPQAHFSHVTHRIMAAGNSELKLYKHHG